MRTQLESRLKELRTEYESGTKMLEQVQAKKRDLEQSLLRISGAIQVLEEELNKPEELAENEKDNEKEVGDPGRPRRVKNRRLT
ncbi:MAG: hypothetical protein GY729_14505 [Desulfobacteraceae bacterium]|nr:hypothetical protein [Desulfobacteraceae bacterium]